MSLLSVLMGIAVALLGYVPSQCVPGLPAMYEDGSTATLAVPYEGTAITCSSVASEHVTWDRLLRAGDSVRVTRYTYTLGEPFPAAVQSEVLFTVPYKAARVLTIGVNAIP
ncbi:MAG TPA: hypothetical protein PKD55_00065 [Bellilinea sp.]|nr:hypothetical protein [Bellilinea sp.]